MEISSKTKKEEVMLGYVDELLIEEPDIYDPFISKIGGLPVQNFFF